MEMSILPAEVRLVLLAARPSSEGADAAITELMDRQLDWSAVGWLAERERLLPILWNRLKPYSAAIPPAIAARLREQSAIVEFRMAMTETTLQEVIQRLANDGIAVMLLKGAALAATVYPSFQARPMGDLDILVAPDQAGRAWALLRAAGWSVELENEERFPQSHHHLIGLVDPQGLGVVLEIHRAMLPSRSPFVFDEGAVWREAVRLKLGAVSAWAPSDQHQLLHQCLHFAWSHALRTGMGRTVRDVAMLLLQRPIDWPRFVEMTRECRAQTCAYWTLALSRALALAEVPGVWLESLRPRQPSAVTRVLARAYATSALFSACPSLRLERWLWTAGIRPGVSGHGPGRPWDVDEEFKEAFQMGRKRGVRARAEQQLRGWARWLRFVRILGSPHGLS